MAKAKERSVQPEGTGNAARKNTGVLPHDRMTPVSAGEPCGPDLEYDPEFVMLAGRVAARSEAQYGDFVGMPEPVNWSEIDRDCRRLMLRAKDIRLAVLFARCRTQLAGADGLAEALELLAAWLHAFADTIHPQLNVDDDADAALEIRMNALQALTDSEGLMSDVREIVLPRGTATRLQVRDVERAFAQPRPADALAPASVTRQLDDLRLQQPGRLTGFSRTQKALASIINWCRDHQEAWQPDFIVLERLIGRIAGEGVAATPSTSDGIPTDIEDEETGMDAVSQITGQPENERARVEAHVEPASASHSAPREGLGRHGALGGIREAREWFERNEPSSPVAVLLRQAERLVGKRYAEVASAIPADLLALWDSESL
jgi:type VI secretion system protein ImpA